MASIATSIILKVTIFNKHCRCFRVNYSNAPYKIKKIYLK